MKSFALTYLLLPLCLLGMAGCATDESSTSSTTTTTTKSSVPGESVEGGAALTPAGGPTGAGANVRF